MSIEPLLPGADRLSDEELRELLAGNLCRCTGYQNIVRAVRKAAVRLNASSTLSERADESE
jgi:carbon-monoxide dehydrogenase small subunit